MTSSILTIGAACAISMSLTRGPVHCHAKPRHKSRIPRFDCHSSRNGVGGEERTVTVAWRDAKSNRVESMFPAALLRCKCIDPTDFSSLFILHSLSFVPFLCPCLCRSFGFPVLLLSLAVGRCRICPCSMPTAQKNGRGKKEREVDGWSR